MFHTMRMIN